MKYEWSQFKFICDSRLLSMQSTRGASAYYLDAWDGPQHFAASIFISDPPNTEQLDFETNYLPKINKPINKKTTSSIDKVAIYEPEGDAATIVSHDFTDPCTWFQGSIGVVDEVLTLKAGTTYAGLKPFWIDLKNGRLYDEDTVLSQNPTFHPEIKVAGVVVTTGFTINFKSGEVTFTVAPTGAVTASYRYADKSWYIIKPKAGKVLSIKTAEVQFSANAVIDNPFYFEVWVNHPTLGMVPVPNSRIAYKNAKDFISACNEGQGLIPKWSGLLHDVHVFPFHYARPKPLKSSQGVEIRVYCKDHKPLVGEFATATFYVNVDNEG